LLRVIVINDGDPREPWDVLNDISDPRLIRFDLKENRGPYFARAVALMATTDDYFLIQDADDWSEPKRVSILLRLLRRHRSNYSFSSLAQFRNTPAGQTVNAPALFSRLPDLNPGAALAFRLPHHGLFEVGALRQIGGCYGGFRIGYDELLTSLLLLVGTVSWTSEKLYWRRLRPNSLYHSAETGFGSHARILARDEMANLYARAYFDYQNFVSGDISGKQLIQRIRSYVIASCGAADSDRIRLHAQRLRDAIRLQQIPKAYRRGKQR
jgi:glycosyltransferase involved in cell wall biosynthesis